jgi:hypothetical protein
MSEVDRLSNSGLYPALPIADRRSSRDDKERRPQGSDSPADKGTPPAEGPEGALVPRPPKSIIDEYA